MRGALWAITWQAALVAVAIWAGLLLWQTLAPGTFTTRIEWWLILVLFAVHLVPRAISLFIPTRGHKRRPKA
jgi:hypothetical protein